MEDIAERFRLEAVIGEEVRIPLSVVWEGGSDAGEAECTTNIKVGELIWLRGGKKAHVLDVVPVTETEATCDVLKLEAA